MGEATDELVLTLCCPANGFMLVRGVDVLARERRELADDVRMREEHQRLDERDPGLRLTHRRLLREQRGKPLRLSICQQQWVVLVSWTSALLLAHPVALVAAHH